MPDIAATDVTYILPTYSKTVVQGRMTADFGLTFGNGTLTYPTGGVPIDRTKMGFPNAIEQFAFNDMANANGFIYKWDAANRKIRIYQGDNANASAGPLVELAGGVATPAAATLSVRASGW